MEHSILALCFVSTVLESYRCRKDVQVIWLAQSRQRPLAPCRALIKYYDEMDAATKRCVEGYVDQLFSLQEARTLSDYLNRHGFKSEVSIKEYVPILFEPDMSERTWSAEAETIRGLPGCPLSVPIVGYYDLSETEPVHALRDIETSYPFTAVTKAGLQPLEIDDPVTRFFAALGSKTGIYLRQEDGVLRVTPGNEPPFQGSPSDLYQEIIRACHMHQESMR